MEEIRKKLTEYGKKIVEKESCCNGRLRGV